MTEPVNEFLIIDDLRAALDVILQGRPAAVVTWFNTVFWNHYRQPDPTAKPSDEYDYPDEPIPKKRGVPKSGKRVPLPRYANMHAVRSTMTISSRPSPNRYSILFKDLTEDMVKALRNGADLVSLSMLTKHKTRVMHFADFLSMYHGQYPDKDLSRISFPQCVVMVEAWDKELARQKEIEALNAGTHELFTASNGCKVLLLHAVEAVEREGQRLGNCLKTSAQYYLNNSGAIIVVRNAEGSTLAAAQLIVKLRADAGKLVQCIEQNQFYGKSNGPVPPEANLAVVEAALHLNWRSCDDPSIMWAPRANAGVGRECEDECDEEDDCDVIFEEADDEGEADDDYEERPAKRPVRPRDRLIERVLGVRRPAR